MRGAVPDVQDRFPGDLAVQEALITRRSRVQIRPATTVEDRALLTSGSRPTETIDVAGSAGSGDVVLQLGQHTAQRLDFVAADACSQPLVEGDHGSE
jgi:hypothetical protein